MYNEVTLVGRLTRDPELRYTQSGKGVCNFAVATDITTGENKITEFVNVVAWQKLAEVSANYLKKGKLVFVKGQLRSRVWEDKNGSKRKDWDVVMNTLKMLSPKDGSESTGSGEKTDDRYSSYFNDDQSSGQTSGASEQARAQEDATSDPPAYDASETVSEDDVPF